LFFIRALEILDIELGKSKNIYRYFSVDALLPQEVGYHTVYMCPVAVSMFLFEKFASDFEKGSVSRFIKLTCFSRPATFFVHAGASSLMKFVAFSGD
jgi:hypothetical protein